MPTKQKSALTVRDWPHADAILGDLCRTTAARRASEAMMNDELSHVRDRYESALAALAGEERELRSAVETFAIAHRADFGSAKSKVLTNGSILFRVTPPSVRLLNRKWTWDSILETMLRAAKRFACWIRTKEEIDKETILATYASGGVTDSELAEIGLRVAQDEKFDVDLNYEEPATAAAKG